LTIRAIDVHHHILPPIYLSMLGGRLGPQGLFGSPPQWSPEISIEAMDRNGIGAAIASISAPGVWFGNVNESCKLARLCNEYAADMKRNYSDRFGLFASLPLPDIDASLREIDYALGALGAEGVALMTNYDGKYPGEPHFLPIFDELNRREAVVFVHPTAPQYRNCLPEIPIPTLEFPFETTRAITSLLYSGTLARCRDIRFVFSHAGGTVPFLAERIARLTVLPKFKSAFPDGVLAELARLYFDTALSANLLAFDSLRRLARLEHVLFGSDYPHAGEPTMAATVQSLDKLGLTSTEAGLVKANNAAKLFPQIAVALQ